LEVFLNSPILGRSLGGIDSAICQLVGVEYTSEINGIGMCIAAEALAGLGIFGFWFLVKYIYDICKKIFDWQKAQIMHLVILFTAYCGHY